MLFFTSLHHSTQPNADEILNAPFKKNERKVVRSVSNIKLQEKPSLVIYVRIFLLLDTARVCQPQDVTLHLKAGSYPVISPENITFPKHFLSAEQRFVIVFA